MKRVLRVLLFNKYQLDTVDEQHQKFDEYSSLFEEKYQLDTGDQQKHSLTNLIHPNLANFRNVFTVKKALDDFSADKFSKNKNFSRI